MSSGKGIRTLSSCKLIAAIAILLLVGNVPAAAQQRMIGQGEIAARAGGTGSIPGVLLRDGTVCITETEESLECQPEAKIPREIADKIATRTGYFDGIYDLDRSGDPEIFLDYWPASEDPNCSAPYKDNGQYCGAIALLVYKKSGENYKRFATLNAPSEGYFPGAWFIDESPLRKAIFATRCGGSSGECLFYLDRKKRTLDLITDDFFLIREPVIEDVDGDGNSEIFITARGDDRTSEQGAALLHWKDGNYRLWWPTWKAPPYVIHAQMVSVGGDDRKELVTVLDTEGKPERQRPSRELAIWKLNHGKWELVDRKPIPGVEDPNYEVGYPKISSIAHNADGADIALAYRDGSATTCRYEKRRIACLKSARR